MFKKICCIFIVLVLGVMLFGFTMVVSAAKFTVWSMQSMTPEADKLLEEYVEEFAKKFNVDTEYVMVPSGAINEKLAAAFESGSPPDVWQINGQRFGYFPEKGLVSQVDDIVAEIKQKGINEKLLLLGRYNGHQYALPIGIDVSPLYIRTDLLEEVGMSLPQTWEEVREFAKAVTKPPYKYGLGLALGKCSDAECSIRNIIWSFGGSIFGSDGEITFDSPEVRETFQLIEDMYKKDKSIPSDAINWDDGSNNAAYQSGQVAIIINTPSVFGWLKKNDKGLLENTKLMLIPKGGPNGREVSEFNSYIWAISKDSKNQELAKEWLRYFYDIDRYNRFIEKVGGRWLPIFKDLLETPYWKGVPRIDSFIKMAEAGTAYGYKGPVTSLSSEITNNYIVVEAIQKVLIDDWSVEKAVVWGQEEMEKIANE